MMESLGSGIFVIMFQKNYIMSFFPLKTNGVKQEEVVSLLPIPAPLSLNTLMFRGGVDR